MQEFNNKCCGECGERFKEEDDVAVCPECGTPIHRACWTGHCPNEDKHKDGFTWTEEDIDTESGKLHCKNCGVQVEKNMLFCPRCGISLGGGRQDYAGTDKNGYGDEAFGDNPNVITFHSFDEFIEGLEKKPIKNRDTGEELTCYGVRQKELIFFLGRRHFSTPRLITLFLRMANTGKKISFNLLAGFLMPYYQFYQKVTGPAVILLLINFILGLPYTVYQLNFFQQYMSGSSEVLLTAQADSLISTFSIISFIIEVAIMLFWDYFYMRWSVNKILNMREKYANATEEEYLAALEKAGNPKWHYTLVGLGIAFLLSGIVTFLLTGGII